MLSCSTCDWGNIVSHEKLAFFIPRFKWFSVYRGSRTCFLVVWFEHFVKNIPTKQVIFCEWCQPLQSFLKLNKENMKMGGGRRWGEGMGRKKKKRNCCKTECKSTGLRPCLFTLTIPKPVDAYEWIRQRHRKAELRFHRLVDNLGGQDINCWNSGTCACFSCPSKHFLGECAACKELAGTPRHLCFPIEHQGPC